MKESAVSPLSGRLALRPEQAAEYLGISRSTFNEWVARYGCEKHVISGRITLYEIGAVKALWERVKGSVSNAS